MASHSQLKLRLDDIIIHDCRLVWIVINEPIGKPYLHIQTRVTYQ